MAEEPEAPQPPEVPPPLSDTLEQVLRRIVYRGRQELRRATEASRDRVERRQARRDLEHFWVRLGKTAYHLVEAGEVDHPALRKAMTRIDDLERSSKEAREDAET
jgi:L-lysine 2,3-aminomutase